LGAAIAIAGAVELGPGLAAKTATEHAAAEIAIATLVRFIIQPPCRIIFDSKPDAIVRMVPLAGALQRLYAVAKIDCIKMIG
jgi:hypothetical protein